MDVLYKGAALLYSQVSATARMLLAAPQYIVGNAWTSVIEEDNGCTYYEGIVTHCRRRPVVNEFEYPVRVALIELDSPPSWFEKEQAEEHMTAQQAREFAGTTGKVQLLTNPVSAGYVQNPISVYYCCSQDGSLDKGIAEVTNTPWGERVMFCFNPKGDQTAKAMHVSPFQDMQNTWHLEAPLPGDKLRLSVLISHPQLGKYFDAHLLATKAAPGTHARNECSGWANFLRYGFMPQRVALWIYWQAVKLVAKGCPVCPKPHNSFRQQLQQQEEEAATHPRNSAGELYVWRDAQVWPWYLD